MVRNVRLDDGHGRAQARRSLSTAAIGLLGENCNDPLVVGRRVRMTGRGCGCAHDKMITEVQPQHIGSDTTLVIVRNPFSKEVTMNVLKAAIVGLVLISANTLVRADVIADWNNTAMDVMKAVNVAGNPWTRSMAL